MKNKLFILICFILCSSIKAIIIADNQNPLYVTSGNDNPTETFYKIPKIIPPSPNASSLGQYGEIPVSLTNGLVNISIPIYEIKVGELIIPINISYHGSGIKVNDKASCVGLGWILNAGGVVTRSVVGRPDEQGTGFFNNIVPSLTDINKQELFAFNMNQNNYDGESDIYFYNFNSKSGRIIFTARTDNSFCMPILQPYEPLKIDYNGGDAGINITDVDGTIYSFNDIETATPENHDIYNSAWFLSSILNKKGEVEFSYSTDNKSNCTSPFKNYEIVKNNAEPNGRLTIYNINSVNYNTKQLDRIDFPGGYLIFTYGTAGQYSQDLVKPLQTIEIFSNDGSKITYNFKYSAFIGESTRLRLDAIEQINGLTKSSEYGFEYNNDISLPACNSLNQDIWGYYNGQQNGNSESMWNLSTFPPTWDISKNMPNEVYMKMAMIKKIIYPTGGFTEFVFEPHKINNQISGGLRIQSQKANDGKGQNTITEYEYNNPYYANAGFEGNYDLLQAYSRHQITYNNCCDAVIKTKTYYNSFNMNTLGTSGSPVCYKEIAAIKKNGTSPIEKSVYFYRQEPDQVEGLYWSKVSDNSWKRVLLEYKDDYKYESGQFSLIKKTHNYYSFYQYENLRNRGMMSNINSVNYTNSYATQGGCHEGLVIYIDNNGELVNNAYEYENYLYDHPLETMLLTQTDETTYNSSGDLTKTTKYEYANKFHLQPTLITSSSSNRDVFTTLKTYVGDMNANNEVYTKMQEQNRITDLIQVQQKKNGTLFNTINFVYSLFNSYPYTLAELSKITTCLPNNTPEDRVIYNQYDFHGNPTDISDNADKHIYYLWSYNNQYPIAEIKNATYTEVAGAVLKVFSMNIDYLSAMTVPNESKLKDGSLQNALSNALVTTYTYKPLVGITSVTDPRGVTTTYNYDDFNRLQSVVNTKNQTTQSFDYNYKQ